MKKENAGIREEIKLCGVPQWMIATQLNISENTLIRWLRVPLSQEREEAVRQAILAAVREKEAGLHA